MPPIAKQAPRDIVLRLVDDETNARRHYALRVTDEPLFGRVWIDVEWGRIGGSMRAKREPFRSSRELAKRWRELVSKRIAHKYKEVRHG